MSFVFDWLRHFAANEPDRLAAVDLATGRNFTYSQFNERAERLAAGLQAAYSAGRGDRIGLLARNSTDHFELMFACWKIGAVFMPLNWRLGELELRQVLDQAKAKVVFCDSEFAAAAGDDTALSLRSGDHSQCGYESLIRVHDPLTARCELTLDDPATLLFTSGTTAEQKGVIGTHGNVLTIVLQSATTATADSNTVCLTYAPLFHTAGLNSFATPLFHFGGTLYVMRDWDPALALALLTDPSKQITHTLGVPFHLSAIASLPQFAEATFPALKLIGVGGAPATRQLIDIWAAKGIPLSQSYGMTEAFGLGFNPPESARENPAAAGKPLMYLQLQIGDEQGIEVPRGERGEIQVRGPGVTSGYLNRPDLTAAAWVKGWFRTGDIGVMDPDGTFYVVDRLKDMFISGGENVYPAEVESVISKVPGVMMVAVIGVPDQTWQEVGHAFVVPRPGSALDPEAVRQHCAAQLARYKVPKHVTIAESLPISGQGKILKWALRDRVRAEAQV